MGKVFKKEIGITLIALVITIIVLLILAGVSIATLTGENGILTQAETAKTETTKAEVEENFRLLANEWQIAKAKGKSLGDFLNDKKDDGELDGITENGEDAFVIEKDGYKETINNKGELLGEPFIGTALNTDKYGWKVKDYTVTTTDCPSGVWRLFYQDSNYTYLINNELTQTAYKPSNYYTTMKNETGELKYQTGADVSEEGQKLSPIISSLFTETNENENIRAVAWLTDTSDEGMWVEYKNDDAVFAMGSPTIELFAASYNSTGKIDTITLGLGTYGYTMKTTTWNPLSPLDNYGIYNESDSSFWWLASPHKRQSYIGMSVYGGYGRLFWRKLCE